MTGDFVVKNDLQRKMTITEKKNFIQMRGNFRQLNISGSICLEFFFCCRRAIHLTIKSQKRKRLDSESSAMIDGWGSF